MLEVFLVVLASAIQSVPSGGDGFDEQVSTAMTEQGSVEMSTEGSSETAMADQSQVLPVFPSPTEEQAAASPLFLSPDNSDPQPDTPIFLSPDANTASTTDATPLFLSPQSGGGGGTRVATAQPQTPQPEPQVPSGRFTTAMEVKPILAATRGNWISVRDFNGQDLLYVTHLWSWRCGLVELRVGVNGNPPEIWPLPPCHLNSPTPNMITESDGLPYRSFGRGQVALIEVQLTYDDLTSETVKFNRNGMPLQ